MCMKSAGRKEYKYTMVDDVVVDDYSWAVFTWPLQHKSEAPEVFKLLKAGAENEPGKKLCKVMTDNMCKVSRGNMRSFCDLEGIKPHMSVRYSLESNEVAERTTGVLTNSMRLMLHDSGLSEAFNTTTYIHNRTLMKVLGGRTPYEMLYGIRPDMSHLRAFGAPCKVVKPSKLLRKLNSRSRMCYLVGYKYAGGGYRVWADDVQGYYRRPLFTPTRQQRQPEP